MKVCVIGAGYVGLTTGLALAYLGNRVVLVDIDQARLAGLAAGRSPIAEPGIQELLPEAGKRLSFSGDTVASVRASEVILIAVGTPARSNGEADTSHVEQACRDLAAGVEPGREYLVVVKSTVPIGTNLRVRTMLAESVSQLDPPVRIKVASNPEFLREGHALQDTFYPDRIVIGADDPTAFDILRRLYRPVLEQTFMPPAILPRPAAYGLPPMITTTPVSAEMIKYAANAFLAVKVSYINEVAGLCELVGADVTEVSRGIGLDPRIGPRYLSAGLGWGGSCLPKDTAALCAVAASHGFPLLLVEAARTVNARQRAVVLNKLESALGGLSERIVGVLGLAFKPGTDDLRESPALEVARALHGRGAVVRAHDPAAIARARAEVDGSWLSLVGDPYEVAAGAHGLVLATDWDEYAKLDLSRLAGSMRSPVLVDARNLFEPEAAREAGFAYFGLGR